MKEFASLPSYSTKNWFLTETAGKSTLLGHVFILTRKVEDYLKGAVMLAHFVDARWVVEGTLHIWKKLGTYWTEQ